jgi:hypothetical protein
MKMNFKVIAVAVGLSVGMASNAQAATYNLGPVNVPGSVSSIISVGLGSFSDHVNFSIVGGTGQTGSLVSNLAIQISPFPAIYNITGLNAALYTGGGTLIGNLTGGPNTFVSSNTLTAGNYYFVVSGTGTGALGGQYVVGLTTTPVPEPETWAMVLAGLGLVGLQLRRKSKMAKEIAIN